MKSLSFVTIILLIMSCQSKQEIKKAKNNSHAKINKNLTDRSKNDSSKPSNYPLLISFIDSVSIRTQLSLEQIKKNTIIDSIYYTGILCDASFVGDTVFNFQNGFKCAIINYDDRRSCLYQFLLVFNSSGTKNLDQKIIYTDCDHDESSDYTTLRYKILNDSTFETIENYIPANSENKSAINKTQIIKWKLNNQGLMYSLKTDVRE